MPLNKTLIYNILMKMYKQTGELCIVKVNLKEKALEL